MSGSARRAAGTCSTVQNVHRLAASGIGRAMKAATNEVTTVPNAAPMTTATA